MVSRTRAGFSRRRFAGSMAAFAALGVLPAAGSAAQTPESGQRQYTFLGLGLDRYSDTGQRSDIIMVSRVDLDAGTVRVLSIPRDLYVEVPGFGFQKINEGYNRGLDAAPEVAWRDGVALAERTITHNFGVQIDGSAIADMDSFHEVVDAIGGVTVSNPYDLTDEYWPEGMTIPEGSLDLDGDLTFYYALARSQDGDGGRVMRQHLVLRAMLEKLQSPEILPRIPELVETLSDVVRTTIPLDVQARLIALIPRLREEDLAFTNIEPMLWSGYTPGGAWIYQGDWSVLPGYVEGWLAGEIE
jgi:polyisoprenyl-teichoic acid--peptidoglycan teichoic acid transferase